MFSSHSCDCDSHIIFRGESSKNRAESVKTGKNSISVGKKIVTLGKNSISSSKVYQNTIKNFWMKRNKINLQTKKRFIRYSSTLIIAS